MAGCKDSSGPERPDVSGAWNYSASNMTGGGLSCSLSGLAMTLSQAGATFTGVTTSGRMSCTGAESFTTRTFNVASGAIAGASVNFDFDTQDWHHTGTLNGNTMSGSVTFRVGTTTLAGQFSATRLQ